MLDGVALNTWNTHDLRESRKSTVIVSQITVKEWYDLYKDCTYANACLDRVLCKAYRIQSGSLKNQSNSKQFWP